MREARNPVMANTGMITERAHDIINTNEKRLQELETLQGQFIEVDGWVESAMTFLRNLPKMHLKKPDEIRREASNKRTKRVKRQIINTITKHDFPKEPY
jgi:hypothetical protein